MTQRRSHFMEELGIIPVGWVIVAGIGAVWVEILFHVLVPKWAPHHDLPREPWWALMGITGAILMAAMVLLTGYIYADAKRRDMHAVLWVLLVILIPKPIGYIAYFLLRKPMLQRCPKCGAPVEASFHFCPNCSIALGVACAGCGRPMAAGFACCPYCGKAVGSMGPPVAPSAPAAG